MLGANRPELAISQAQDVRWWSIGGVMIPQLSITTECSAAWTLWWLSGFNTAPKPNFGHEWMNCQHHQMYGGLSMCCEYALIVIVDVVLLWYYSRAYIRSLRPA